MGGQGGGVLSRLDRRARREPGLDRAVDLGAGRRAAHRRDDLLYRDAAGEGRPHAGALADADARRRRRRDGRRADGGRPLHAARPRDARPHDADRLDAPRACRRREGDAGRRHRRPASPVVDATDIRREAHHRLRHAGAGARTTAA